MEGFLFFFNVRTLSGREMWMIDNLDVASAACSYCSDVGRLNSDYLSIVACHAGILCISFSQRVRYNGDAVRPN